MTPKIIKKLLNINEDLAEERRRERLHNDLIRHEAKIGGRVFGPLPAGASREFFCLDKHTWVWHEQWQDKNGQHQNRTTKYLVRPSSVLKSVNGQGYQQTSNQEMFNLLDAARVYQSKVKNELYAQVA